MTAHATYQQPAGISVVICTYNGAARLAAVFNCMLQQQYSASFAVEVVVVDNRSADGTSEMVRQYFDSHPGRCSLTLLHESRPGKAFALETGYDAAQYDLIITCDDDNWLAPDYLQTAWDLMGQLPEVGILGGYSQPVFDAAKPDWFDHYKASYAAGAQAEKEGYLTGNKAIVWGAGMVLRRQTWQRLRACGYGFVTGKNVTKAVGEDTELSLLVQAMGYALYYTPRLKLQHHMPAARMQWAIFLRMCRGFGHTHPYMRLLQEMLDLDQQQRKAMDTAAFRKRMLWLKLKKCRDSLIRSRGAVLWARGHAGNKERAAWEQNLGCIKELLQKGRVEAGLERLKNLVIEVAS